MGFLDGAGQIWDDLMEYLFGGGDRAEEGREYFPDRPVGSPEEPCPYADQKTLVLIPRKMLNIWNPDRSVRELLPPTYGPGAGHALKTIERNFYPDLNRTRSLTAVVTAEAWSPHDGIRPNPRAGITVYFSLGAGTTADVTLSAGQATTDAEGCATIDVTVNTLHPTKAAIEAANRIVVLASLDPTCGEGAESIELTVHRNEDVDLPLAADESPAAFAATLRPVLDRRTWLVRQTASLVTSNGVLAVQQLLNQVACRKKAGGHVFLEPDGQFGNGGAAQAGRFIASFCAKPAAGAAAGAAYAACQFGVGAEEDAANARGVKTYVRAEYGAYEEGRVIDAGLLAGPREWTRGAASRVMEADGLLDIYAAAVFEFIEATRERGMAYVNAASTWYRHPKDNGPDPGWPATVTQGVAYGFGAARTVEEFTADLAKPVATPPATIGKWQQLLKANNSRIGIHKGSGDNNTVSIDTADRTAWPHLNTDPDVVNQGTAAAPKWRLVHVQDTHLGQYSGIDCSGFCHRVAIEAKFRPGHCSDLVGQRICPRLDQITHNSAGWPVSRLNCTLWHNGGHYKEFTERRWRHRAMFRSDLVNVTGSHIVMFETADRNALANGTSADDVWVMQASGDTVVPAAAIPFFNPTENPRRVIHSPLAAWPTAWNTWPTVASTTVHYGRIYLWN